MSPKKPAGGSTKASALSPSPSKVTKSDGAASKRQKRDGIAANNASATPAAAAAAAASQDYGSHIITQLTYAVDFLKSKGTPKTLQEIMDHLTLQHYPEHVQKFFATTMQRHSRMQYRPDPKAKSLPESEQWRAGTYEFKPMLPGVTSKVTLLEYLQSKTDASATEVKAIKDGWPNCDEALMELEAEHKILTVRTKKEQTHRFVWLDNPALHHKVDDEFRAMWFKEPLPSVEEMPRKLKALGQKATSGGTKANANAGQKAPPKRKKASRVQKKFENEHMRSIFEQHKR
ncbi:transcription initiation factor IIE, beta subunit [Annulohypoxylon truncatum]|uniref:transcription initiation factor IIE, beta subunit n=1 Tax=Annulohypoxylon truncatum TaxID=327061 RepID=UPI002008DD3A|nr:transcription initiation factor IIE, beta subunit [Annulohypoxylon truncatum]KAI1211258.1 transcription initiation factor IIE, beta subunit [Annulohypoxylon truncatum]